MTKVKICGLTNLEDAQVAAQVGADMLGFIFYKPSPRYVKPEAVREIVAAIRNSEFRVQSSELVVKNTQQEIRNTSPIFVGVFVNETLETVQHTLDFCGLDVAQLHGDEPPEMVSALAGRAYKALRPQSMEETVKSISNYQLTINKKGSGVRGQESGETEHPAVLLDAYHPTLYGGTGQVTDWTMAKEIARQYDILLAGSLTPENVAEAVQIVQPWGVDVSSGVEAEKGRKDWEKVRAFVEEAKTIKENLMTNTESTIKGKFGPYGGQFVPETLMPALAELEEAYNAVKKDEEFQARLAHLLKTYVGRPTALTYAGRLTSYLGGAKIYLKREDLAHTGAHKINNALGQAMLAQRMGKHRIVAETGAGQHGVGSATACALLGLECIVYMGEVDIARQQPNVFRMKLAGTEVRPVSSGSRTLKDAINEAIRDWVTNVETTHYLLGSALGPHPYPTIVRDFQSVIGREARAQILEAEGRLPDLLIACVGGASNAIGLFHPFLDDKNVDLLGVEAGGSGIESGKHAARFAPPPDHETGVEARLGVLHGTKSYVLQTADGQIAETHSISAGLDYPSVGPEHAWLRDEERAGYTYATDEEALEGVKILSQKEGIIPALESAHAVAEVMKRAPTMPKDSIIVVNISGRGDKDLDTIMRELGE